MVIVVSISFLAIILSYLSQFNRYKNYKLFELAFLLVTFLACTQYRYGTDYLEYYSKFKSDYHYNDFWQLIAFGDYKEPGWAILNHIFPKPNGFFCVVAIIGVIENFIYYKFIKDNVSNSSRWISMLIYLCSTSFWLLNFSMIRQGFAVSLCVAAAMNFAEKKRVRSLFLIALAISIHITAICFLPFILLSFFSLKNNKIFGLFFIAFIITAFFVSGTVVDLFIAIVETNETLTDAALYYGGENVDNSIGLGFVIKTIPYLVLFFFLISKHFDNLSYKEKIFLILSCVSFSIIPIQITISGYLGRLGTYFAAFQIVTYPVLYTKMKDSLVKAVAVFAYLFMLILSYYSFFFTNWSAEHYGRPFKTIFSVIL